MRENHVTVLLQFPQMVDPVRVELAPRDLFLLEMLAERQCCPNGQTIYRRSAASLCALRQERMDECAVANPSRN